MTKEELSSLTDQELLAAAKKMKSTATTNALIIGFMVGIIIFSIWKNSIGLFTLIPLYLIYRFVNNSKDNNDDALKEELKNRGIK